MKKLISLVLILALVLAMVLPTAVFADTTVNGHVLGMPTVTHVYMHGTSAQGAGSPTASLTSAVDLDIIGTNFDTDVSDPLPVVTTSATTHITVGAVTVASATKIYVTFTVDAAYTSGNYDVFVSQGGMTSAQSSNDYFLVHSYGTVTAPSAIALGLMSMNATAAGNDITTGNLNTNDTTWAMTVKNTATSNPTNTGYMSINGDGTGGHLAAKFQISKDSAAGDFVAADTGLSAGTTYINSGSSLPLYVKQAVATGDAAGTYSITITFSYSPTN